jgi:hypothetical protein
MNDQGTVSTRAPTTRRTQVIFRRTAQIFVTSRCRWPGCTAVSEYQILYAASQEDAKPSQKRFCWPHVQRWCQLQEQHDGRDKPATSKLDPFHC